jgi:hypothetical protein
MKDFTPEQAESWVLQEFQKLSTRSSLEGRLRMELEFEELCKSIPDDYPNSSKAHRLLIQMIEAELDAIS